MAPPERAVGEVAVEVVVEVVEEVEVEVGPLGTGAMVVGDEE
jgi:hypothetical protein